MAVEDPRQPVVHRRPRRRVDRLELDREFGPVLCLLPRARQQHGVRHLEDHAVDHPADRDLEIGRPADPFPRVEAGLKD
ncbi:MAG TPA: hypothetical protein PK112_08575 [candidate division Zixibacteria bacterium]|nr:hypothetical protein [candidate division Zixibacteria bacterium]